MLALKFTLAVAFISVIPAGANPPASQIAAEAAGWEREAKNVTIARDDWGIAHITGKTDADAVFGMIYAQAEDDFNRIETNYLTSMGRLAEAEGESRVWQDFRQKLFIDPEVLKQQYAHSPKWLQKLMTAWASGLNYYLAKHPEIKPRVIHHFEPWMALSFTEGSIGGDIERINLQGLQSFYDTPQPFPDVPIGASSPSFGASGHDFAEADSEPEPGGSNGIAIAPSNTKDHHALLLINPHTSFFFRSEIQVSSLEGLNAYGAVTWGQFFVYQGFNDRAGWMHTSSGVDAVDEYLETMSRRNGRLFAKYGGRDIPMRTKLVSVPYRIANGMAERKITAYWTRHGPVVREANGKWVSVQLMQKPIEALEQSYLRTKAKSYAQYRRTMELKANSSNNTVFADADGDIAYFHGNFIPRRDTRFDFTKPVDGSDPATDWHGLLTIDETPHLLNPKSGYLFNVNNWPWTAAGESSPKREDYPAYIEKGGDSERGVHAVRLLKDKTDFTLDSLLSAAFDSYLPWFEKPVPALVKAWNDLPDSSALKTKLRDQIALLRTWNLRWAMNSVPTSLAVFWGQQLSGGLRRDAAAAGVTVEEFAGTGATPDSLLTSLAAASDRLTRDFGRWDTPWGTINRFQRLTGDIVQPFDDNGTSIPVGFTSSEWGSLAAFGARPYPGTKKWYGTSGNSFVAVVEFGERVRAKAVTAGGESGHPASKHFDDEAERYSTGNLRDVYFYADQLKGHIERLYHPGE